MSSLATQFVDLLGKDCFPHCNRFDLRTFAGKTFLYATTETSPIQMKHFLETKGNEFLIGTIWKFECVFVRESTNHILVYQISFLAPNEKSFCCGNQCPNCILKKA